MDIVIPTSGRWLKQPTLAQLVAAKLKVTLVVQAQEYNQYVLGYGQIDGVTIVALPEEITTISPTRQYILEHVGVYDNLCMVDDDLLFYQRRSDEPDKLEGIAPRKLCSAFLELEGCVTANAFQHAGFAAREGANRNVESYLYHTRMMRVLAYDRVFLLNRKLRFDRTPFMQDFDMHLQILRSGGDSIMLNNYAHNQGSSNAPGGCSVTRTKEKLAEAAHRLKELHPDFVRLVEKETKGAWGGGTRIDVTVAWKKAYLEGQKL